MWNLMVEGGWPIWFTLAFGLVTFGAAIRFARSSNRKHLPLVTGMSLATGFSILTAVAADLAAVGHHAPDALNRNPDVPAYLIYGLGFAEALSPAILGFTLLSLTWLVATVGLTRSATQA